MLSIWMNDAATRTRVYGGSGMSTFGLAALAAAVKVAPMADVSAPAQGAHCAWSPPV